MGVSTVIRVEGLSKKYIIGHQSDGGYSTFREMVAKSIRNTGKRFLHPFRSSSSEPLTTLDNTEEFWALRDVSFEVKQGERVGIIGRNGAGKTTLLKILSRITEPTGGKVSINGKVASLLEVGTGFHPELTGRENIFLNGAVLGMGKDEIKRRFDEIVDFSEVERFLDTPVKRYSSGMYVRLAFAVAAHLEPEILLVDEVLAVGDAQFQKKCLGKMEDVSRLGRTVLFVSHNMNAINRLCSRTMLISEGAIVNIGSTDDIVKQYISIGDEECISRMVFPDDDSKPYQVLEASVQFMDGQTVNRPLEADEPFEIYVKYEIKKPMEKGWATLAFRNQLGEIVCFSDIRDSEHSVNIGKPGITEARIRFPAPLLIPGIYSVTIALIQYPHERIDSRNDAISFEVVDLKSVRLTRPGHINPQLVWREATEEQR